MNDPLLTPHDPHDQLLRSLVAPPDWNNPTARGIYNLVVVGGGPAGLVAAAGAAGLGARVALIERRLLGGDCLNFGCVPSKALIRTARSAAEARRAAEFGVRGAENASVDFAAAMQRVRRLRASLAPHDSADRFRSLGVDVFLGDARFLGPDRVAVGGAELRFARACIATGSSPLVPAIPGLAEAGFLTNESVFQLTELPRRLAIIGGGPIGCELAQALARCGARVTLLARTTRLLPRDDPSVSPRLERALARDDVDVRLRAQLREVQGPGRRLVVESSTGSTDLIDCDQILVATGRLPNVAGLGLESAGVAFDPRDGVRVDDYLRTSNRRIYAAGDVCCRLRFTHAADAMARIVLRNALFFGRARLSQLTIPWCTYTDPEVAHVGWQPTTSPAGEANADKSIDTWTYPLEATDRAALDGDEGLLTLHLRRGTDRIVGATLVAPRAGEMLAPLTLAVGEGIGLRRLATMIHPYPTQTEVLKRAADQFQRSRLTSRVRWLFETVLRWRRGG